MTQITDEEMRAGLASSAPYTAVILRRGPQYGSAGADAVIWEHGRRNFALRAEGHLAIVCPVADDSPVRGIGIFTGDVAATTAIMDDDPGVTAGIFTYDVHPVRGFPGDSLPAPAAENA
jgi:hypothetical protein